MALTEGQWQIRDLVMGPGTKFRLMDDTSLWELMVRATQGGPRAWNHGTWSGAEWGDEKVVPIHVLIDADDDDPADWLAAHQQLAAAFAPSGDRPGQVELRAHEGGREYVVFGRPRGVRPDTRLRGAGKGFTRCGFVAQDPRIYSGELHTVQTSLPTQTGGFTFPLRFPLTIPGVLDGGREELLNEGTTDTGLLARIDGPIPGPRVVIQRPDGEVQSIRFDLTLAPGQWLDVDTASRTALLNGLPESNQRGRAAWDIDPFPLAKGTNVLRFAAGDHNEEALLTAWWRSAWW